MQLSDSETRLLIILRLIPLVEKRAKSKTIISKTHEGPTLSSARSPHTAPTGRVHCVLYQRTSTVSYARLPNQKIGSMKKPAITLTQPGINNVGTIE